MVPLKRHPKKKQEEAKFLFNPIPKKKRNWTRQPAFLELSRINFLRQLDYTPQISLQSKSERHIWEAHKIIRCILVSPVSENLWSTFWYPLTTDAGNDSDQNNALIITSPI
jgi:hypothetical protein